ncbi:MAG: redox-regulated ATPase YchF [Bacillota bacterium]|nr:redox-regulated ATPase YchF [Bacillota bacterium]
MKIGVIGLPMSGKTTVFNLLTQARHETSAYLTGRRETNVGVARVPDKRVDHLAALYKPRKTTYATIEVFDVVGLVRGSAAGQGVGNEFLNVIRDADALIHVVRAFSSPGVAHVEGSVDPWRDLQTVNYELLLSDLDVVEKRIAKIQAGKRKPEHEVELAALEKCRAALTEEKPIQGIAFTPGEAASLRGFTFFTEKPVILVVNLDEAQFRTGDYPGEAELAAWAAEHCVPLVPVCGQLEAEILELSGEDREAFLADLGLSESGVERIARAAYRRLGYISFFTVGEDEVRAWPIHAGTCAKEAAGKVHSDLERGFIRAEVVSYDDLVRLGTLAKVREAGLLRLEGKDYVVRDGDVIHYRFAL